MNVLIIFVLLFRCSVKGLSSTELPASGTSNTSVSTNSFSTMNNSHESQNINKPGNNSVTDTGNQFDLKLDLRTIFIFVLGVICSTVIFSTVLCLVAICKRCKATDANTDKASIISEAVRSEHDQLMMQADEGQADKHNPLHIQTPAEVSTNTTEEKMKILGKEQTEEAGEVTEVDYAAINFSLLPKKDDRDLKPQKEESDYAEIQLNELKKGEDEVTQGQKGGMEK